jgi:hypothetical protein
MNSSSVLSNARPSGPLAGIGLMLAGIAMFSVNDALGKWLLVDYSYRRMVDGISG